MEWVSEKYAQAMEPATAMLPAELAQQSNVQSFQRPRLLRSEHKDGASRARRMATAAMSASAESPPACDERSAACAATRWTRIRFAGKPLVKNPK